MIAIMNIFSLLIGVAYLGYFMRGLFVKVDPSSKQNFYKLSSVFIIPLLIINFLMLIFGYNVVNFQPFLNVSALVVAMIVGIVYLHFIFNLLKTRYQQKWLTVIYYIGIGCTFFLCLTMAETYGYQGMMDQLLFAPATMIIVITISAFPFALLAWFIERITTNGAFKQSQVRFIKGKSDKLQYYREQGLSERDIIFFREEMAQAKAHIENIEKEMNAVAKLRIIETRNNTIDVSKQFFKDIVRDPQRLPQAGIFLNKLLPSLADLTAKYTEISQHVAKNKQTYIILERSAQTIEKVCQSISEQYLTFHQNLFNDLDDEIKLANKTLDVAVEKENDEKHDIVDDLVNDAFQIEEDL